VSPDTDGPIPEVWEDLVRLPCSREVVEARLRSVIDRVCRAELVDDSLVQNAFGSVAVSPTEAAVVGTLLASPGRLMTAAELSRAVWPEGAPSPRALSDVIYRLRRQLKPLRLMIFNERSRGYRLGVEIEMVSLDALSEVTSRSIEPHRSDPSVPDSYTAAS
jgi:DNA-binding response OmpR family regulator